MSDKQENSGQAPTDVSALRKRAEEQARSMEPTTSSTQPPEAIEQMLYELRVHQIELEMQNEELRTAQAEIEAGRARYFDLYDLAPVGYCTLSEKGLVLEANLAAATLLGMARSTLIKQPISRFIPKEDQDIYYLHRKILFETGETQECELRMSRREGMSFWAHLKIAAAQQEDCVPVCRVVMSDITERVRMEAERKKLQTQLQQAQKMEAIGTLAGGIAHDFNNILMAIIGYAEMAQENSPAGSILRKDIDQIINASHRAREFVKKILVFSRQAETECTCFQPALILKENIDTLCSVLPSGITIQQDIDHEAGPIFADPMRIHQVMTNLCANAFHAMEKTGGTLSISLKNRELTREDLASQPQVPSGRFVQLSVGDTGPGIALEIREKIFDPYFTTKEVDKGTGMGLAVIHGIANSYKGFVNCDSKLGQGTVFHVYLPVLAAPTLLEPLSASLDPQQPNSERILFVEDEEILAEMSKVLMERLGYLVTVRRNSLEALNTFQKQPDQFDLVITDQTMPGMTGIDMAKRMLQIRPGMPIILCTGYGDFISEDLTKLFGIKGFAMKPLAKKDIAKLIREVLTKDGSAIAT